MTPFVFKGPTDKLPGAWHQGYPIAMARLLNSLKDTKDCVVEIGTDGGSPLLAYRDWFQDAKMVVGVDVNPAPQCLWGREGIRHYQMDAYTPAAIGFLKSHGEYACVIDDGSHFLNHQQFFVENYAHLLTANGIAIIEDIQDPTHIAQLHSQLPDGFMGYVIDLRLNDSRYDSLLYCFSRK